MAYDEGLAERIRAALAGHEKITEKKMFGGIAFMMRGNMCCGVINTDLIVRVGPDQHDEAMSRPHAHLFDFTGRPMRGMVKVAPEGIVQDGILADWIELAINFVISLPPK